MIISKHFLPCSAHLIYPIHGHAFHLVIKCVTSKNLLSGTLFGSHQVLQQNQYNPPALPTTGKETATKQFLSTIYFIWSVGFTFFLLICLVCIPWFFSIHSSLCQPIKLVHLSTQPTISSTIVYIYFSAPCRASGLPFLAWLDPAVEHCHTHYLHDLSGLMDLK